MIKNQFLLENITDPRNMNQEIDVYKGELIDIRLSRDILDLLPDPDIEAAFEDIAKSKKEREG